MEDVREKVWRMPVRSQSVHEASGVGSLPVFTSSTNSSWVVEITPSPLASPKSAEGSARTSLMRMTASALLGSHPIAPNTNNPAHQMNLFITPPLSPHKGAHRVPMDQ